MQNTLYLTAVEREIFAALPKDVIAEWNLEPETGAAYETSDVLRVRAGMARFDSYPELLALTAQAATSGKPIDAGVLAHVPESVLPELYFTIGACGLSAVIPVLLTQVKTDDDLEGVAGLSVARHDILRTNASISYA